MDAAQPEHQHRPEHRVAVHAGDALGAAADHARDEGAVQARIGTCAAGAGLRPVESVAGLRGVLQAEGHAADVGLVRDVGAGDLQCDGEAQRLRGPRGGVGVVRQAMGDDGHAGALQQRQRLGFAQRAGWQVDGGARCGGRQGCRRLAGLRQAHELGDGADALGRIGEHQAAHRLDLGAPLG